MIPDRVAYGIGTDCDRCQKKRPTRYLACRAALRAKQDDLCVAEPLRANMTQRSTIQQRVLAAVQAAPEGIIRRDMLPQLGLTASPVTHALSELVASGAIRVAGKIGAARVYVPA